MTFCRMLIAVLATDSEAAIFSVCQKSPAGISVGATIPALRIPRIDCRNVRAARTATFFSGAITFVWQ